MYIFDLYIFSYGYR